MNRVFFLFVFGTAISGCLFATRTPDMPNTSNAFLWTPATTPDYLLQNLTGALKLLDASDYIRVFVSSSDSAIGPKSFSFTPAPGLDQSSRGIFVNWTTESEGAWVAKLASLLSKNSQLTIILSNEVTDQNSGSSASISADYTISIPTSSSSTVIPGVVKGSFQMQLAFVSTEQGAKEWRIVSWSDFLPKNGTGPTWTDLKVKTS
jgi:hypothetical protein